MAEQDTTVELDITYRMITTAIFVGLLISVIWFPDFLAVVIIVASVAGLALRWLSRQFDTRQGRWQKERQRWERGERWW